MNAIAEARPFYCSRGSLMGFRLGPLVLGMLCLGATPAFTQDAVVTNATEAALRSAIANGGTVQFACDGVILLGNPIIIVSNTVLDGVGHQITISGNHTVRVIQVASGVSFSLANLTIADGVSPSGAGLYNDGGFVTATNCLFSANVARQQTASPAPSLGGAICNAGGQMELLRCVFTDNGAYGGLYYSSGTSPGCNGCGGAVYNGATLRVSDCSFFRNAAAGADAVPSGYAPPFGSTAFSGGTARGGAIDNAGWVLLERSVLASNSVAGGRGANGASNGTVPPNVGPGQWGGDGGSACGGALSSTGVAAVVNCTLAWNQAAGAAGGTGGAGSRFWYQGVYYTYPDGMPGSGGSGVGGIWSDSVTTMSLTNCTLAQNTGSGGGGPGNAAGGLSAWQIQLVNTLLATNRPANCGSTTTDLGHNISSDASFPFSGAGSQNNVDPQLTPLADNGGPTLTMALLCSSPAIDAGDTASAPATDQRGVSRPSGPAADVGAYEFPPTAPDIVTPPTNQTAAIGTTALLTVTASGSPRLAYQWVFNQTTILQNATNSVLVLADVQPAQAGSYRVVVTNLFGAVTSSAAFLTVTAQPPVLTAWPSNQTAVVAATVQLAAAAVGSLPLGYQWFFNTNTAINDGADGVLTLTNVQLTQAGTYTVVATNAFGAATSPPAVLTVVGILPNIVSSPTNKAGVLGSALDFAVSAAGTLPLAYQWYWFGTNALTDATNAVLHLAYLQYDQAGLYHAVVTNAFGRATSSAALLTVTAPGTTAVANPTEGELRAALAGGGRVIFACDGLITLSDHIVVATNAILDGVGRQVALSGSNATQIFHVNSGVVFGLANLTLANGAGVNGGALVNAGGTVNATNCLFSGNRAIGPAGIGIGVNGTAAGGGAIYNNGAVVVSQCAFLQNRAEGGRGSDGSSVAMETPPPAGVGASGSGGALYNLGTATVERSLFASNSAAGGLGGMGSAGDYYISPWYRFATPGGSGGAGAGGAFYNAGQAGLVNCTFAWNRGTGGAGGTGGSMNGPTPYISFGSSGGMGGDGIGGIYGGSGLLSLTNCTVAHNSGTGGSGGSGGSANIQGHGGAGGGGAGGLSLAVPSATLVNCLLATNNGFGTSGGYGSVNSDRYHVIYGYGPTGYSNGNLHGDLLDTGHNLSSDASSGLTNSSSLSNTDPKLGTLADHGGLTLTLVPAADSPAVDAAAPAVAPPIDQRGYPRTFGPAPDIGAVEYWPPGPFLLVGRDGPHNLTIRVATGIPGQSCILLVGSNLLNWLPLATNQVGADGFAVFSDSPATPCFYRAVLAQ